MADYLELARAEVRRLKALAGTPVRAEPQPSPVSGSPWSPVSLAAERKFRIPAAKLYPLLDHVVLTPAGAGILLKVFDERVQVHLNGKRRTREFRPEQIAVAADARRMQGKPS